MKLNYFFEEVTEFPIEKAFENWVYQKEVDLNITFLINYIYVSDNKILTINKEYLNHDYFTDIITFDLSESNKKIKADIFISVDTVRSNAIERHLTFKEELVRVMVHGILHLIGFNDKTDSEQFEMTRQENNALEKIFTVSRETK